MTRECRVSPDGNSIAVQSDFAQDGPMAFGVWDARNGGGWCPAALVRDWGVVDSVTYPEPE
jgi:hypothetical protein